MLLLLQTPILISHKICRRREAGAPRRFVQLQLILYTGHRIVPAQNNCKLYNIAKAGVLGSSVTDARLALTRLPELTLHPRKMGNVFRQTGSDEKWSRRYTYVY